MPGGLDRAKNRSAGLDSSVSLRRNRARDHISSVVTGAIEKEQVKTVVRIWSWDSTKVCIWIVLKCAFGSYHRAIVKLLRSDKLKASI